MTLRSQINPSGRGRCKLVHSDPVLSSSSTTSRLEERHEVDFAELADGSLVEMVEDPADSTNSLLAVYENGTTTYTDRLPDRTKVLVPLSRSGSPLRHICLPEGVQPYGGVQALLSDANCLFGSCLDIESNARLLMTAFVLATWLPEKLPCAPYLALVGPPGSGKTTALRILSLLCRRSLPTSDITSAAFYDVCHRVHPTILIDEASTAGHPRTLLHLLRSSSSPGFIALRKDKAQLAYGPKVLSWIELPNDAALNSRCIVIPMCKTARRDLRNPDDPSILHRAAKLRRQLLQFRFEHYHSLSAAKLPGDIQLSPRALDQYRALAFPFGEDQELCKALAYSIADQSQLQYGLLSPSQGSAVRVLFNYIHTNPRSHGLLLTELTGAINDDLESRDETCRLTERKTGNILTSVGLTNRSRANAGYVVHFDQADRQKIHKLADDYEVDRLPIKPEFTRECPFCTKAYRR